MENENEEQEVTPAQEEAGMLKAYKELQANTVSKEKYEKDIAELEEKNKIYLKAITGEGNVDIEEQTIPLEDQIKDLSKFKGTNLEYWTKMTKAIDGVLEQMPEQELSKTIGADGLEELINVNEGMKTMVKDSDGSPDMFRALYKQRIAESAPKVAAAIEREGGVVNYMKNKE